MSTTKKLVDITNKQIKDMGVQALADRPNVPNQYGVGGMSPEYLKRWFDNLATMLAKKINKIHGAISGDEAAQYIRIALDSLGVENLDDLVKSFRDGSFARSVLMVFPEHMSPNPETLQQRLDRMSRDIAEAMEHPEYVKEMERIVREAKEIADRLESDLFVLQKAPPLASLSDSLLLTTPTLAAIAAEQRGETT